MTVGKTAGLKIFALQLIFSCCIEKMGKRMIKKIALNGMGRIGVGFTFSFGGVIRDRLDPHQETELEIVHINDLAEPAVLAHLLEFDLFMGAGGQISLPMKHP